MHSRSRVHSDLSITCTLATHTSVRLINTYMYMCIYIYLYIYIYTYAVELLIGPSLGVLIVIHRSKFAFFKKLFVKQHYANRGFSTFFVYKKIARANFNSY